MRQRKKVSNAPAEEETSEVVKTDEAGTAQEVNEEVTTQNVPEEEQERPQEEGASEEDTVTAGKDDRRCDDDCNETKPQIEEGRYFTDDALKAYMEREFAKRIAEMSAANSPADAEWEHLKSKDIASAMDNESPNGSPEAKILTVQDSEVQEDKSATVKDDDTPVSEVSKDSEPARAEEEKSDNGESIENAVENEAKANESTEGEDREHREVESPMNTADEAENDVL